MRRRKRTYKNLAAGVKKARKDKGLTQLELAHIMRCHPQYISNFERGLCYPPISALRRAVKTLGLDPLRVAEAIEADLNHDNRIIIAEILRDLTFGGKHGKV